MVQKVSGEMLEDGFLAEVTTGFTPGNYTRVAADGSIEERTPTQVRTDIGAGTGSGSVTSVNLVSTTGLTASGGPITGSGSLTYTLSANLQAWHGLATSAKQDADPTLTALAGANWAANSLAIGSGADTVAQVTFAANTFPGRSSTGNLVAKTITDAAFSILDDATVGAILTTIGGQPLDATLTALAGQNWAANAIPLGSGADTMSQLSLGANTIPGRSSAGNVVAKPVSDAAFTILNGQLVAGTYTPTLTAVTNVTSITPRADNQYLRVGNTVTVSGQVLITPTAGAFAVTEIRISLPVATALTTGSNQIAGVAVATIAAGSAQPAAVIYADVTNDAAILRYNTPGTGSADFWYHFTYQVV